MKIEQGLFARMVLQRAGDVSDVMIAGTCGASGLVTATVRGTAGVLSGFDGVEIGEAVKGRFAARLTGVPVGGPYTVELCAGREKVVVADVLVGDVWICAGQSNMQGCGIRAQAAPPHPLVRAFYMDDRWAVAQDPIHNMWDCVDQVHIDYAGGQRPVRDTTRGVGPSVAFAQEMHRRTGVPQGVLACAHGGTSMAQWNPKLTTPSGSTLYSATMRRVRKNGGRVAGIIWYQGCSDADAVAACVYTPAMVEMITAFRHDCKDAKLPCVLVQIAGVHAWDAANAAPWHSIQEQQRLLPTLLPRVLTVPAIDLDLDDLIHISGAGQQRLGRRVARGDGHTDRREPGPGPIALKRPRTVYDAVRGCNCLVVEFANVIGELTSPGLPSGFAFTDEEGKLNDVIFRTDIQGNSAILARPLTPTICRRHRCIMGWASRPIATSPTPPIARCRSSARCRSARARHDSLRPQFRVSDMLRKTEAVRGWPSPTRTLMLRPRQFDEDFANLHPEISAGGQTSGVVYYACRFACPSR